MVAGLARIAFLTLDESDVPAFTIVDHRETRPEVEVWRYPKAGDPNPKVALGVVDAAGGARAASTSSRYASDELLIVRVGWTPDGKEVVFQVQNRMQTWLDLLAARSRRPARARLFRDTTAGLDRPDGRAVLARATASEFLWLSERDGLQHLYLYDARRQLIRRAHRGPVGGRRRARDRRGGSASASAATGRREGLAALPGGSTAAGPGGHRGARDAHGLVAPNFAHFVDTLLVATPPRAGRCAASTATRVRTLDESRSRARSRVRARAPGVPRR